MVEPTLDIKIGIQRNKFDGRKIRSFAIVVQPDSTVTYEEPIQFCKESLDGLANLIKELYSAPRKPSTKQRLDDEDEPQQDLIPCEYHMETMWNNRGVGQVSLPTHPAGGQHHWKAQTPQ